MGPKDPAGLSMSQKKNEGHSMVKKLKRLLRYFSLKKIYWHKPIAKCNSNVYFCACCTFKRLNIGSKY